MGFSGGIAGGVAASGAGRERGGGGDSDWSEKKARKEGIISEARDIISKMDDVQEARKKAIEINKINGISDEPVWYDWETGELSNVKKMIDERMEIGGKAVEQIERKGGVSEARRAIEALEQVIQQAKDSLELKKNNPEVAEALSQVIENAENNLKIKKTVFDQFTSWPEHNIEWYDPDKFKKKTDKDDKDAREKNNINKTRERIKQAFKKDSKE